MFPAVGIFSVPRSGSSWLGQLINSHPAVRYKFQPLFSHEFGPAVEKHFAESTIARLLTDIFDSESEFLAQSAKIEAGEYPAFVKSSNPSVLAFKENTYLDRIGQILEEVPETRAIFLIRDPIKVIESWFAAPREFPSSAKIEDEWEWAPSRNTSAREFFGYRQWESSTGLFLDLVKRFPTRTNLVQYEALSQSPFEICEGLFDNLGLDFDEQTREFISESTQRFDEARPYSVFRSIPENQIGDYSLKKDIVDKILLEVKKARLESFTLAKIKDK